MYSSTFEPGPFKHDCVKTRGLAGTAELGGGGEGGGFLGFSPPFLSKN